MESKFISMIFILIVLIFILWNKAFPLSLKKSNALAEEDIIEMYPPAKIPIEVISQPGIGNITPGIVEKSTGRIFVTDPVNYMNKSVYIQHRKSGLYLSSMGGVAIGGATVMFSPNRRESWMIGINNKGSYNISNNNVYGFIEDNYQGKNTKVVSLASYCGGCTRNSIPISIKRVIGDNTGVIMTIVGEIDDERALSITYEPPLSTAVEGGAANIPLACFKGYKPEDDDQIFDLIFSPGFKNIF